MKNEHFRHRNIYYHFLLMNKTKYKIQICDIEKSARKYVIECNKNIVLTIYFTCYNKQKTIYELYPCVTDCLQSCSLGTKKGFLKPHTIHYATFREHFCSNHWRQPTSRANDCFQQSEAVFTMLNGSKHVFLQLYKWDIQTHWSEGRTFGGQ